MYSMAMLGMNTYIYAPKDDLKHRMHWRDLYSVDEAGKSQFIGSSVFRTCYCWPALTARYVLLGNVGPSVVPPSVVCPMVISQKLSKVNA